jgi:hypothetical protein
MPNSDSGFHNWLLNFARLVSENPSGVGLSQSDAAVIASVQASYDAAFQAVQSPSTRTPAAVGRKDSIKASAMATMRVYAGLIRANRGVTNQQRLELGLGIENASRAPIPAPTTQPVLFPMSAGPLTLALRYADVTSMHTRRKPPGVTMLWLAVSVLTAEEACLAGAMDPKQAQRTLAFTKSPFTVEFSPRDACKTAYLWSRWGTARGLLGPWGAGVCHGVANGGPAHVLRLADAEQEMFRGRKAA